MAERETFILTRDVNIVTIPDGTAGTLSQGDEVTIHQSLGNNYTVVTEWGNMVRIAGVDADALGKEPHNLQTLVSETSPEAVKNNCWEVMKTVYDPEIPVNIVDLGLVYDLNVEPSPGGGSRVSVKMTLTAPGCGMGPVIASDAQQKIQGLPGVDEASVEVVWDPPWHQSMISAEGRRILGLE